MQTQRSHKFDLERHRWFTINMRQFIKSDSIFPTTPWVGIILDGYGNKPYNVLGRCSTVQEYWGAIHAMRLMKKQFPFAYVTNEQDALGIHYSGLK